MFRRRAESAGVAVIVVLGLLLASCAPLEAPTPTPKPAAPAPTKAPAAAPTAPAAVPTKPKPAAPTPSPKPVAEQPRYGGILTLGHPSDPPSLDPHREQAAGGLNPISTMYSGLLQYDTQDNEMIIPDLADRWELSSDGLVYTFYLKKDVRWHDGQPFTSADVKYSLERLSKATPRKRDQLQPIAQVDTPDQYTVKLTLENASASLPAVLAVTTMLMGAKHAIEAKGDLRSYEMGTGPFKLKSYSSGVSVEVVKNKEYFVPGLPYLDGITTYIIKDKSTLLGAFRTGRIKMNTPDAKFTSAEAKALKNDMPEAIIQSFNTLRGAVFFMNMSKKPWDDVRVRRAVHLLTDRQAANQIIAEGEGKLGGTMVAGQWAIPEEELLKQPGFRQPKDADIAEAKRLLATAGYSGGFQTTIFTRAGYPDYLKMAEFITDQLSKLGIRGQMDPVESAVYNDRVGKGMYETMATGPIVEIVDPDGAAIYFVKGNRHKIEDQKLQELFAKQGRTADPEERKKLVLEMQYRTLEIAPYVVGFWFPGYIAFWPEVKNYKPGVGQLNNSKYQDVWLAK